MGELFGQLDPAAIDALERIIDRVLAGGAGTMVFVLLWRLAGRWDGHLFRPPKDE